MFFDIIASWLVLSLRALYEYLFKKPIYIKNKPNLKRLDQNHLHSKLEVPGLTSESNSLLIAIQNIYI
jgi:hypothetical protein